MALQLIELGTPDDRTGDKLRPAGVKINSMFTELYGKFSGSFTPGNIIIGGPDANQLQDSGLTPFKTFVSTIDPTAAADISQGYVPGSFGFNSATGRAFVCRSNALGAAVWVLQGDPNPIAGNWFTPDGATLSGTGAALASTSVVTLVPFKLPCRMTISHVGAKITTIGSTNAQFGIYNASATTRLPTTNIDKTASIANTSLGFISGALGSSRQLEAGLYWFGVEVNDVTCAFAAVNALSTFLSSVVGNTTLSNLSGSTAANMMTSVAATQAFGTWGDLTGATWSYRNNDLKNALPYLLTASVP